MDFQETREVAMGLLSKRKYKLVWELLCSWKMDSFSPGAMQATEGSTYADSGSDKGLMEYWYGLGTDEIECTELELQKSAGNLILSTKGLTERKSRSQRLFWQYCRCVGQQH